MFCRAPRSSLVSLRGPTQTFPKLVATLRCTLGLSRAIQCPGGPLWSCGELSGALRSCPGFSGALRSSQESLGALRCSQALRDGPKLSGVVQGYLERSRALRMQRRDRTAVEAVGSGAVGPAVCGLEGGGQGGARALSETFQAMTVVEDLGGRSLLVSLGRCRCVRRRMSVLSRATSQSLQGLRIWSLRRRDFATSDPSIPILVVRFGAYMTNNTEHQSRASGTNFEAVPGPTQLHLRTREAIVYFRRRIAD
eukprot:6392740-Alexandrium_andersonii.AAC.1